MRRLVLGCAAVGALIATQPAASQPAASPSVAPQPAKALPAASDRCLLTRLLQGHTVGTDGHTLYFGANGTDVYQVTTGGPCLAHATASDTVILQDRGLGKICHPADLDLTVRGMRCSVDRFVKLTPAEIAALPKRLQP